MNRVRIALAVLAGCCAVNAFGQQQHGPVEVSAAVQQDSLPSLKHVNTPADGYKRWHFHPEHELPVPYFPKNQEDGALQTSTRAPQAALPAPSSFDGVGNGFPGFTVQYAPPDTVGAVGATQYVQVVNVGMAVFDKTTKAVVLGPIPTSNLWQGFGGQCESDNDGDAVVVYDQAAGRWIVSQFAVGTTPYLQCVAVSQTSDATGGWFRYAFSYGSVFPDYPKMGVWPDAYYETFNMFTGNTFSGSKLCAYDRAKMLTGATATQVCFQLASSFGGVLPSDLDGSTQPPAGSPNYMLNFGTNSLNLWKFHVDFATPSNSSIGTAKNIAVAAFTPACGGGTCIPQSGVRQQLDSLADRLMFRLAYRNFGGGVESLVVAHSVKGSSAGGKGKPTSTTGVRWYELRNLSAASPTVYQQSTFSPADGNYRWMPSIAQDKQGNMALGYSVSSGSIHPALAYTGRLAGDTLNTMQAEQSIYSGLGSQTGQNLSRWGDYSAMTVDPADDCTFWYTTEYIPSNGAFNWSTRIASFKFPGCN